MPSTRARLISGASALALLAGCSKLSLPGVYRMDIQQGNVITQEQLATLEPGMEKRKVRFILGTPLVADAFNQDRWDYYYSFEHGDGERVQRIVSAFFEDDRLVRIAGDVRPASGPIAATARREQLVAVPAGAREEGLLASLVPDFLSRSKRASSAGTETAPESAPEQAGAGAAEAQAPAVEITPEDADLLKALLAGYGKQDVSPPPAEVAQGDAPRDSAEVAPSPTAEDAPEGLWSRWARQLGIKDEEVPEQALPPPPLE